MLPTKEKAEEILKEAENCNPGPWGNHSRAAAHCAERIAFYCDDMDSNRAYILGLLHDIGRKFGHYSQQKWDSNMALRKHFEQKMGMDLYAAVEKDTFRP